MARLTLLVLLLSSVTLSAQDDFLRGLARDVCNCLDGRTTEAIATDCLKTVATDEAKAIRRRYEIDVSFALQRSILAELMLDYLLSECPLLQTIRPDQEENEFRWADRLRSRETPARKFIADKRPPPDTTIITSEPPLVWRATGTLLVQPGSKGLRLLTRNGEELNFEFPIAVARKKDFDAGDEVSLVYRREWRPGEGRIVLVVTGIDQRRQ